MLLKWHGQRPHPGPSPARGGELITSFITRGGELITSVIAKGGS